MFKLLNSYTGTTVKFSYEYHGAAKLLTCAAAIARLQMLCADVPLGSSVLQYVPSNGRSPLPPGCYG